MLASLQTVSVPCTATIGLQDLAGKAVEQVRLGADDQTRRFVPLVERAADRHILALPGDDVPLGFGLTLQRDLGLEPGNLGIG